MLNNFQRSLDDFIMGIHDPRNPANEWDWMDEYDTVVDKCDWLHEKDITQNYDKLGGVFQDVIEPFFTHKHFTSKERQEFMREHAADMAAKVKTVWDTCQKKDAK